MKSYDDKEYADRGIDWDLWECLNWNPQNILTVYDIEKVLAVYEGKPEVKAWRWILEMKSGHYIFLEGYSDYTEWDCQSWASSEFIPNLTEAHVSYAVNGVVVDEQDADEKRIVVFELMRQIEEGKNKTWYEKTYEKMNLGDIPVVEIGFDITPYLTPIHEITREEFLRLRAKLIQKLSDIQDAVAPVPSEEYLLLLQKEEDELDAIRLKASMKKDIFIANLDRTQHGEVIKKLWKESDEATNTWSNVQHKRILEQARIKKINDQRTYAKNLWLIENSDILFTDWFRLKRLDYSYEEAFQDEKLHERLCKSRYAKEQTVIDENVALYDLENEMLRDEC